MKTNVKILALAILIPLTTGCNKTPSDADIKNSIAKAFEQCPLIEVKNFKKKNGFINEEHSNEHGNYIASVQYDIHVTPPKENALLLQEINDRNVEISNWEAEWKSTNERIAALGDPDVIRQRLYDELKQRYINEGIDITDQYGENRQRFDSEFEKNVASDITYNNLLKAISDIQRNAPQGSAQEIYNAKRINESATVKMRTNHMASCKIPNLKLTSGIYDMFRTTYNLPSLYKEYSMTLNGELNLIKTDNGWVIKEFYDL